MQTVPVAGCLQAKTPCLQRPGCRSASTGSCQLLQSQPQHAQLSTRPSLAGLQPRRKPAHLSRHGQHVIPHAAATQLLSPELLSTIQASPVRDLCASAFAVVGGVAWVKVFDWLSVKGYLEQKLSRKLVHMTAGPLFLLTWPLFSAEPYARYLATVVPGLNAIRLVLIGTGVVESEGTVKSVSREGDRAELLRGPLYYVLVLIGVTIFYWRASPVGLVALSLMCGGDGLADIVGRRLGKTKLPYNPSKTYAGSIAMFLGGLAMSMGLIALFCSLGYFRCSMGEVFPSVAAISLVATLIESLPINQSVDDNLSVPGSAALMGYLLLGAVAPAVL